MPRPAYPKPCHSDGAGTVSLPTREVYFLHPGYPAGQQVLVILPAADESGSLHHETARLSCAMIAGNRFDGFLSEDQEGQRRLPKNTEARLHRDEYYYQVPGEEGSDSQLSPIDVCQQLLGLDVKYTVFPYFRQWRLPAIPGY